MQSTFRRFENLLRLLTTLVLSLSALGMLLIPGRMDSLINDFTVPFVLFLGASIYIVGLFNQASIFIVHNHITQQSIDWIITACLGLLSFLYFRAHLVFDGISLAVLVCGQFYLLTFHSSDDKKEQNLLILGFIGLNFVLGFLLLFGLFDPNAYPNLNSAKISFGLLYLLGSAAGTASFLLYPRKVSQILSKLITVPWTAWVLFFALKLQLDTVVIAFGFAMLPLLRDLGSWNKLRLPPDDSIGRRVIRIASMAEFLMVLSLVIIGYNSYRSIAPIELTTGGISPRINQDFSFVAMLFAKGFTLYGLMVVTLTINRLKAEWTNPDFDEKEFVKSPFNSWSRWVSNSVSSLASPSRALQTKVDIQSGQIASLTQQLQNEKKRSAQLNLLAELSHQLEAQLDHPGC